MATDPGNTALGRPDAPQINVVSTLAPKSDAAQSLVRDVRAVAAPAGTRPLVGVVDAALVGSKPSVGDGHLSSLLGFTAQPMDVSMTVLMFCVAFGSSMDYEVLVTSRIKELHALGEDNESAVTNGLGHAGRIVTAAACLIAVSFFAFGTAKLSFMQPLGLVRAPLPAQGP